MSIGINMAGFPDRKHRSELHIVYTIISVVRRGGQVKKTHIMNAVNLNSSNAAKYLGKLVKAGILEEVRHGREIHYRLTGKGLRFAEAIETIMAMLAMGHRRRLTCDSVDKLVIERSIMVQKNVYLVSPVGVKYAVDYYLPEAGTVILLVDSESQDSLHSVFHRVVSMALTMRGTLHKIIVVAPGDTARQLLESISLALAGTGLERIVEVYSECNGAIVETILGRLGPHTAPHRPHAAGA